MQLIQVPMIAGAIKRGHDLPLAFSRWSSNPGANPLSFARVTPAEIVPLCTSTYCEAFAKPCAQLRVNATCNIEHSDLRRRTTIGKIISLVGSLWHSDFGCAIFRGTIPRYTMLSNGDLPRALPWR